MPRCFCRILLNSLIRRRLTRLWKFCSDWMGKSPTLWANLYVRKGWASLIARKKDNFCRKSPLAASAAQPKKLERKAYLLFRQLFMLIADHQIKTIIQPTRFEWQVLVENVEDPVTFHTTLRSTTMLGGGIHARWAKKWDATLSYPTHTSSHFIPDNVTTPLLSVQYLSEEMHCEPLLREFCHTSVFPLGYRIMPCTELPEHLYGQLMKHKPFQHSIVDDTTA